MITTKDYYQILEIERDAGDEEIKKAFRRLALQFHPDTNPDNPRAEEMFKEINEAYSVLSDQDRRGRYDTIGSSRFEATAFHGEPMEAAFSRMARSFPGQGRRRGMEGRFGLGGCGRGGMCKDPLSFFKEEAFRSFTPPLFDLELTSEEARMGVEKEIFIDSLHGSRTMPVIILPGMEDGSLLQVRGEDIGLGLGDLILKIRIID